jgi:hypothetical protein
LFRKVAKYRAAKFIHPLTIGKLQAAVPESTLGHSRLKPSLHKHELTSSLLLSSNALSDRVSLFSSLSLSFIICFLLCFSIFLSIISFSICLSSISFFLSLSFSYFSIILFILSFSLSYSSFSSNYSSFLCLPEAHMGINLS